MSRILIAESYDLDILQKFANENKIILHDDLNISSDEGVHVYYQPDIDADDLANIIEPFDALLVRPKEVSQETIKAGKNLKLIIRGGAGVNTIAVNFAKEQGIIVENTPGQNAIATAEYSFYTMMTLLAKRPMQQAANDVIANKTKPLDEYMGYELKNKKIAIAGLGNIGKAMLKRAKAFEMDVVAFSRSLTLEQAKEYGIEYADSFVSLCKAEADILSLNMPLNEDTRHSLNNDTIALLKSDVIVLNAARPALIDPDSFRNALEAGKIGGFAIDGDYSSFGGPDNCIDPFIAMNQKELGIITPHIADCTKEAQENIANAALGQVIDFFINNKIVNPV